MTPTLGTALTPMIGRERELRALEARLAKGARLVTLLGPGGSGKTRLAQEVFDRHRTAGVDAYFVDLVGIHDPDLVPAEIATELGVTETMELDAASAVVTALRDRPVVLVLDNLEELTGSRDFLGRLLNASPVLQLLATSRIPLGIAGEIEFQVPPLDLPRNAELAEVEASPAGALFLERARAVGRLDEVDEATAAAIAELCRRLDGLPLALELAAARTRILPPAAILRRLDERIPGLLAETRTRGLHAEAGERDQRHRSLDAVLAWSIDLLDEHDADVLSAVAICPGGFDLDMARAVAPNRDVLGALGLLVAYGLVSLRDEVEGEAWYRLLETIRTAAVERATPELVAGSWRRLAIHVAARVQSVQQAYFRSDESEFRRLDALIDNVRALLDWTETNESVLNLAIATSFTWYWASRGWPSEGIPRLRAAIAANPDPSADLASAHSGLAFLARSTGDSSMARHAAGEAARIARIVGDAEREAEALTLLILTGDPDTEASARLGTLLPEIRDPALRYLGLGSQAWTQAFESGFSPESVELLLDAERTLSGTSYRRLQTEAAGNAAQVSLYRHLPEDALEQATRGLSTPRLE